MKDLKLIDFEKEPYLGSGRLYQTSEVYKLLKQQAELTRKETIEEFGYMEREPGESHQDFIKRFRKAVILNNKQS